MTKDVPSAQDLVRGVGVKPPNSAAGIYRNVDPRNYVHMRFAYEEPDKWSWFHVGPPASGFVSDGTAHVVVEDGSAAIVTTEGEVHTTHRLRNLFNPRTFHWDGWRLSEVSGGAAIGRPAWLLIAEPTMPGKKTTELAFDKATGVILFMQGDGQYLGFDELTLDEPITDDAFVWDGPVEPRKIGHVNIIKQRDGTCTTSWEVSARRRWVYTLRGPVTNSLEDSRAWAEERAEQVFVREE